MLGLTDDLARDEPLRLLCLGAHADDIEIGAAGTVLRLLERPGGLACRWSVFSADAARAAEARAAAADLLAPACEAHVEILDFRESYFPFHGAAIKDHVQRIRAEFDPHLVLTHARHDRHQDHRLLSDLTWNAFRDHLVLEYEIPKWDGDLGTPNVFVPIDRRHAERKVRAILSHFATQRGKDWFDEETFWAMLRIRGVECSAPSRYAEAFHGRKLVIGPRP